MTFVSLGLVGASLLAATRIFAVDQQGTIPTLVQKIATTFNLTVADVQRMFDEERQVHQKEMQTQFENRLTKAVTDGKLTEEQKLLISAKHAELTANRQSEMQSMQGKTEEERKQLMEEKRTQRDTQRKSLEDWATKNGMDISCLMGEFRMGGMGKGRGR